MKCAVIIPTYNRSELLGRVLRALLFEQTAARGDYEVIVVDDGSTDATAQTVQAVGAPDWRLRYLRQENKGPAAARNLGLRHTKERIVLFTGDDCVPESHFVSEHLLAHQRDGDVGVVGHIAWDPKLPLTPLMAFLDEGTQFGFGLIKDPEDAGPWVFYTANCSAPRHWIDEVGGFDESFKHAVYEDIELAYRMSQRGLRIVYRPSALTYHHHAPDLASHLARQRLCGRAAARFWQKHPELEHPLRIDEASEAGAATHFIRVASMCAHAVGVREVLRAERPPGEPDLETLWREADVAKPGEAWLTELLRLDDGRLEELARIRTELRLLRREFERVTSRRLYRWSEWLARTAWRAIRAVSPGRRTGPG